MTPVPQLSLSVKPEMSPYSWSSQVTVCTMRPVVRVAGWMIYTLLLNPPAGQSRKMNSNWLWNGKCPQGKAHPGEKQCVWDENCCVDVCLCEMNAFKGSWAVITVIHYCSLISQSNYKSSSPERECEVWCKRIQVWGHYEKVKLVPLCVWTPSGLFYSLCVSSRGLLTLIF